MQNILRPFRDLFVVLLGGALCLINASARDLAFIQPSQLSMQMDYWSVEDGLPHETVTALAQTPDGYLWCGSFRGLTKFDGVSFETLSESKYPELKGFLIYRMEVDSAGRLWVMGLRGKMAYLNGDELKVFGEKEGMPKSGARRMRLDEDGVIWFLERRGKRFYRVEGERVVEHEVGGFPAGRVQDYAVSKGVTWVVDNKNKLYRIEKNSEVEEVDLSRFGNDFLPTYFFVTRSGKLGLNCNYGALQFVEGEWREWALDPMALNDNGQDIFTGVESPSGELWLSTYAVGPITKGADGRFKTVYEGERGKRYIRDMIKDVESNIWFATDVGLYRARESEFRNFGKADGMLHTWVLSMSMDSKGGLWFANQVSLYYQARGSELIKEVDLPREVSPNCVYGLPSGGVAIGKLEGKVFLHKDSEWKKLGDVKSRVLSFCEDEEGNLWVGASTGLWKWDGERLTRQEVAKGTRRARVEVMERDLEGRVVASVLGHGVWRHSDAKWEKLSPDGEQNYRSVMDLSFSSDGTLWGINQANEIVSYDGNAWTGRKFECAEEYVNLRGILPDSRGKLWLSSSNGVFCIDAKEWLDGPLEKSSFYQRFTRRDGLGSVTSTRSSSGMIADSEGRVWVATQGGASVANHEVIDRQQANIESGLPIIHGVELDHEKRDDSLISGLVLEPGSSQFKIEYTGTLVGSPEEAKFRYRLVGLDGEWKEVGDQRFAIYTRPEPGRYEFELQVANGYGRWSPQLASLPVLVKPSWWERKSVHAVVLLIIVALIFWAIYARFRRIHALNKLQLGFSRQLAQAEVDERRKIASDLHDSLGQGLLVLKSRIEMLLMKKADMGEQLEPILCDVEDSIRQTREISYDLHPANLERLGLASCLSQLARRIEESTGITIEGDIDDQPITFSKEQEIHLYRIAQEALSNAARYSESSLIHLGFMPCGTEWELSVCDEGVGIDLSHFQGGGHGLQNMRERARLIEADFSIQSELNEGVTIKVRIEVNIFSNEKD